MKNLHSLDSQICALYLKGLKQKEIALSLGCSQQKVSLALVENKLGKGRGGRQWNDKHFQIISSLVNTHTSEEIAKILSVKSKTVQKKIRLYKKKGFLPKDSGFSRGECKTNYFFVDGRSKRNHQTREDNRTLYEAVAEKKIGRKLLKGEDVHHIDGDTSNNSPENLAVLSKEQHRQVHLELLKKLHEARKEKREYNLQKIEIEALDTLSLSKTDVEHLQ